MFITPRVVMASKGQLGFRYWRVFFANGPDGSSASLAVVELELRGSGGGADLTTTSTPITASTSRSATFSAEKAIDNNTSTLWLTSSSVNTNQNLTLDMGARVVVRQVAILPTNFANERPKDIEIQASDDGVSFSIVKAFPGNTSWTTGEYRIFDL